MGKRGKIGVKPKDEHLERYIKRELKKLPQRPNNSELESKFFVWLAGLLSSDGCISYFEWEHERKLQISLCSSDLAWLKLVTKKAKLVDIHVSKPSVKAYSNVLAKKPCYQIRFETRKTAFFLLHYAKDWLMPRKLKNIKKWLDSPIISKVWEHWIKNCVRVKE